MRRVRAPRWAQAIIVAGAISLATMACRNGPEPFTAPDREELGTAAAWQLTFNVGNDRAPVWAPGGDSIYYTAEGYDGLPRTAGVLLSVPLSGGVARTIVSNIQLGSGTGSARWLLTPAVAPDAERVAYTQMWAIYGPPLCGSGWGCTSTDTTLSAPPLGAVYLRVRRFDETRPPEDDPGIRMNFEGRSFDTSEQPFDLPGVDKYHSHPFQVLYILERSLIFRPSWAPDGQRLVTSDGLRLLLWTVGQAEMQSVPGTAHGVSAAWSPDGEWIAFTRLGTERTRTFRCTCIAFGEVISVQDRTIDEVGSRIVSVIRPDGTGLLELSEGDEPAWAPDGATLYFRRGDQIWRVAPDGTALAPVPGTVGGREPAVSPDGRLLAFSRRIPPGAYDIWIVRLDESS